MDPSGHIRVANWLASAILDATFSVVAGASAPGLSIVKSILKKSCKSKALKTFYRNNKKSFITNAIKLIDLVESSRFLGKVVSKAKSFLGQNKAKIFKNACKEYGSSIGWGALDDVFWRVTAGKTAFDNIANGFSFGAIIISIFDYYHHYHTFRGHIQIGKKACCKYV